jgi:hypothetical protein
MGFFSKAKSHASTFFGNAQKHARSFISQLPKHIATSRKAIESASAAAKKGADVLQHVNKGIQGNDAFGSNIKQKANQVSQFADLGLQKIDNFHKGSDQFLSHIANTPGIA